MNFTKFSLIVKTGRRTETGSICAILMGDPVSPDKTMPLLPSNNHLPVTEVLEELKSTLNRHHEAILQAPPGAGKTTLVPLALAAEP